MARPKTPDWTHQWPWNVYDNPMVQDAVPEYGYDLEKLSAIWHTRYDEQRADVSHGTYEQEILLDTFGELNNIQEIELSRQVRSYIESQIKFGIYKHLNSDPDIRKYMGSGHAGPIDVDVKASSKLIVTVSGPEWLRFYFTGWRTYTVHGKPDNIPARGMLVFYNSEGQKIVTRKVTIPGRPPGMYVEKAIDDCREFIKSLATKDIDDYYNKLDATYDELVQAQEHQNRRISELEKSRIQNMRRQLRSVYNPLEWDISEEEDEIHDIEEGARYEQMRRENTLSQARLHHRITSNENRRRAVLAENEAIEAYLEQYAFGIQLKGMLPDQANSAFQREVAAILGPNPKRSSRARAAKVEKVLREKGIIK